MVITALTLLMVLGKPTWQCWRMCLAIAAVATQGAWATDVVRVEDHQAARQWVTRHLEPPAAPRGRDVELQVWSCLGGLLQNGRAGQPLHIGRERFPRGVREVADRLHQQGTKFVLWFEPERVTPGSWLAAAHPDWILNGSGGQLLNLGHPQAWKWAVDRIDALITSEGVDVYRQDFNMQPLSCWRAADVPDREGITEIRHVQGYLAFWDELLRRHPNLCIDTCASGGRRNDLETLRRSVPLLRSDCFAPAETQQAHTMGLASWIPYFGSGMGPGDVYWYRSCIFPASRIGLDTRSPDQDFTLLKRMMAEFHAVEKYLLGDYYPLTPHSLAADGWVAWQFDRPEQGEGMVQAFRRGESPYESARMRLRGLAADATYRLEDFDADTPAEIRGAELLERGLLVTIPQSRSARIIRYQRIGP